MQIFFWLDRKISNKSDPALNGRTVLTPWAELNADFSRHVLNDIVNFQSHWITTVEMIVCPKIQYRGYQ